MLVYLSITELLFPNSCRSWKTLLSVANMFFSLYRYREVLKELFEHLLRKVAKDKFKVPKYMNLL